jgi:hypothetical protein
MICVIVYILINYVMWYKYVKISKIVIKTWKEDTAAALKQHNDVTSMRSSKIRI